MLFALCHLCPVIQNKESRREKKFIEKKEQVKINLKLQITKNKNKQQNTARNDEVKQMKDEIAASTIEQLTSMVQAFASVIKGLSSKTRLRGFG
ncbi:hypothetical protein RFI_00866 [Reticulomyxa filosa]|uniref:Uncharacterized protein n=1 Tax=Reticulomyxa filosa TaxID=46433 RepID=X6PDA8_RETFI|nr:hypothetical protein RFI_00866 [Reticulomyxa filosa]|eukprot:ETO36196.1 hypothetical protein RFI_00866 [Reticulomyxa filosa]